MMVLQVVMAAGGGGHHGGTGVGHDVVAIGSVMYA